MCIKKSLFCLFFLTSLVFTNAQVTIGTDLCYGKSGYTFFKQGIFSYNSELPKGSHFEVAPKIGFGITDNIVIGVVLGYSTSTYSYSEGIFNVDNQIWNLSAQLKQEMSLFHAGGFFRYKVHEFGNLSINAEVSATYSKGLGKNHRIEYAANQYNEAMDFCNDITEDIIQFQVVPLFIYDFGNHFSMDLYLNFASLVYTNNHVAESGLYRKGYSKPAKGTDETTHNIELGLYSRNSSLMALGFNYTF